MRQCNQARNLLNQMLTSNTVVESSVHPCDHHDSTVTSVNPSSQGLALTLITERRILLRQGTTQRDSPERSDERARLNISVEAIRRAGIIGSFFGGTTWGSRSVSELLEEGSSRGSLSGLLRVES